VNTILEFKNVQKRFGATEVIRGIDLSISAGERVALIGPNGAGKTTLFNLVSGRFAPSAGEVWLKNQRIDGKKPYAIARLGLARSFQATQVFSKLTVYENLR
jgi:branched-chain amino acid transport system ATP-binding protein